MQVEGGHEKLGDEYCAEQKMNECPGDDEYDHQLLCRQRAVSSPYAAIWAPVDER